MRTLTECWCIAEEVGGGIVYVAGKFKGYKEFYAWFDETHFGYNVIEDGNGFLLEELRKEE
jgi:hypothetical protein